jgi:thiaminase
MSMKDPTEQMTRTTRIRELVGRLAEGASPEKEEMAAEIFDTLTALESGFMDSSIEGVL